jgi:Flp pilus assembly pilin Flp
MLASIRHRLSAFYADEGGAQLLEYILLTAFIGIAAMAGIAYLGGVGQHRSHTVAATVDALPG